MFYKDLEKYLEVITSIITNNPDSPFKVDLYTDHYIIKKDIIIKQVYFTVEVNVSSKEIKIFINSDKCIISKKNTNLNSRDEFKNMLDNIFTEFVKIID